MHRNASASTLAAALLSALGITPFSAQAASITVTTIGDSGASSDCTLRQAIVSVNAGAVAGTGCTYSGSFGTNDTINFDIGAFPNGGANTIALAGSQLVITAANLGIDASSNGNVTIDANHASRVMLDSARSGGALSLSHLTLRNGNATNTDCNSASGGSSAVRGGGICIPDANLTLESSTLSGNSGANGGGIYTRFGSVTLTASSPTAWRMCRRSEGDRFICD